MNLKNVVIEENVGIPKKNESWADVLRSMEIGDSFLFVPRKDFKSDPGGYFAVNAKRVGIRIAARTVPGGYRIWRVS